LIFSPEQSYQLLISALSIKATATRENAGKAIKLAIGTKSVLNFSSLVKLEVFKSLGSTPATEILNIYDKNSLVEFKVHLKKNPSLLKELGVSEVDATRKIRILTLSSIALQHVGESIPYSAVATALDIPLDQVELWVIDGRFVIL
jgi:translation initiation factor 3 subunit M